MTENPNNKEDEDNLTMKESELLDAIQRLENNNSRITLLICFLIASVILLLIAFICDTFSENLIQYLIGYFIINICFLFAYKYEYHAYMKDKELSNELKKIFYIGKINSILKK